MRAAIQRELLSNQDNGGWTWRNAQRAATVAPLLVGRPWPAGLSARAEERQCDGSALPPPEVIVPEARAIDAAQNAADRTADALALTGEPAR